LPADQPDAPWQLIAPRRHDHEYHLYHHGQSFFILSNDKGRNFRVVKAPVRDPGESQWQEVVPHRTNVMLTGLIVFTNHLVVLEREAALPHLRVTDLRSGASHRLAFPERVYATSEHGFMEFDSAVLRYDYESLVTPESVFDYDMDKREAKLLKQQEVPGGYDPGLYTSERLHATAADGTRIPVSLVYRK